MRQFMQVTKALADENRIRILLFLDQTELCLCQVVELLKLSPSTVSKHVSILAQAGLVEVRKEGRWHYYRRRETPEPAVAAAYNFVNHASIDSSLIRQDRKALKKVLRIDKEQLCGHYAN